MRVDFIEWKTKHSPCKEPRSSTRRPFDENSSCDHGSRCVPGLACILTVHTYSRSARIACRNLVRSEEQHSISEFRGFARHPSFFASKMINVAVPRPHGRRDCNSPLRHIDGFALEPYARWVDMGRIAFIGSGATIPLSPLALVFY